MMPKVSKVYRIWYNGESTTPSESNMISCRIFYKPEIPSGLKLKRMK